MNSSKHRNWSLHKNRLSQKGQSLIEVTFASAVVALVLVAVLSLVITSLQQARRALEQPKATQHAQAAVEWIRSQRDQAGWGSFYSALAAKGGTQTYCWQELPVDFSTWVAQSDGECDPEDVMPETDIQRTILLNVVAGPPQSIEVQVEVARPGQGGEIVNTLQTSFTDWE